MFKNSLFFKMRIFIIILMIAICIISNAGILLLLQKHQGQKEGYLLSNSSNALSHTLMDKIEYLYEKASIKSNAILAVKAEGRNLVFYDENKKYLTYNIQKLQYRLSTTDLSTITQVLTKIFTIFSINADKNILINRK